jgi:hypothetical protein
MCERYVLPRQDSRGQGAPVPAEQQAMLRVLFSLPATSGSRPGRRCTEAGAAWPSARGQPRCADGRESPASKPRFVALSCAINRCHPRSSNPVNLE